MKNGKIWGETFLLYKGSSIELHRIKIKAGHRCSMHLHQSKINGFYVISGKLEILVKKNDYDLTDSTMLEAGDFMTVKPGEYHQFICHKDCLALEIYFTELDPDDIIRKTVGGKVEEK